MVKRTVQSFAKETDLLQDIRDYFDTQTAAGKQVSRAELLEKFFPETIQEYGKFSGTTAKTPALKAALGDDYDKLVYKGSQFDAPNKIKNIVKEVVQNKRPLTDAANKNLQQETGASKRTVSAILNKISEYKNKVFPKLRKAVQRTNEEFFQVKLKDFDKLEKKFPRTISRPGSKQDFILQSLVRHDAQGGEKYKVISGNNFANYKVKDTATGEIYTRKNIIEKIKQNDPKLREASQVYDELQEIKKRDFIDPITKQNIGLGKALQKATGVDAPLHIHHVKGVAADPLNNLQVATYKANLGGQIAKSTEDFKILGIRGVQEGGKNITGAPGFNIEQNVDRFSKFANRKILSDAASGFQKLKTPTQSLSQRGRALPGVLGGVAVGTGAAVTALADTEFGDPDTWDMKVGDYLETGATVAAAAPLATKKGRSIYGKAAKQLAKGIFTPLGAAGLTYAFRPEDGYDLSKAEDRLGFEAEAAFSKDLVRQSAKFNNPLVQRALNLGLSPAMAMRAARIATPLGIASLGAEGAYQLYKAGEEQQAMIDAMSPEERENFFAEQEGLALAGEAAEFAAGGRVGFKTGGKGDKRGIKGIETKLPIDPNQPIDPDRRAFMEKMGMGGLGLGALMAGAVKFGPEAVKAVKKATPDFSSTNVPAIVEELYSTIKNFGKQTDYPKPGSGDVKYEMGPYKLEEGPGGYNITKTNDRGEFGYSEEYFGVYRDPETGAIEYEELTVQPDMEGKLKDVDYGVDAQTYREIGEDLSKTTGQDVYKVIAEEDIKGVLDDGGVIMDQGVLKSGK